MDDTYRRLCEKWEQLRILVFLELGWDPYEARRIGEEIPKVTPKIRGVLSSFQKLQHNLDADAEKLGERIKSADSKREEVFAKSHKTVASAHMELDGIDKFLDDLDKTNAGPLDGQPPRSSDIMNK